MSKLSLSASIAKSLQSHMAKVSDRILRLEASKDWPLKEALELYKSSSPELRVFIQRPFKKDMFDGLTRTDDAKVATKWRNDSTRSFDIVLVGATGGPLGSGLKDVRRIDRQTLISDWQNAVLHQLPEQPSELGKPEVRKLLSELFKMVATGSIRASLLEQYISDISATPTVAKVCDSLWVLGLLPDPQAVDTGMSKKRLARNADTVTTLRTGDDPQLDRKLEVACGDKDAQIANVAKAALAYRESGNPNDLRHVYLPVLERVLVPGSVITTIKTTGLEELLDACCFHRKEVCNTLDSLSKDWSVDAPQSRLEAQFIANETNPPQMVRVELTPLKRDVEEDDGSTVEKLDYPWTRYPDDDQVLAATSPSSTPETLSPAHTCLTASRLLSMDVAREAVESFLAARREVGKFEPWLENNAMELLLLSEDAFQAAKAYLRAWQSLAEQAVKAGDARALVEAVQVLETVSGPGETTDWILLGPLHPYRLDPTLKAVEQCRTHLTTNCDVDKVGSALSWTLDKSFPAYPTIHRRGSTLYQTSNSPHVVYSATSQNHLPSVRDSAGLDRVTKAIDGFSPWLRDGMTVLAIDPPCGGGVAKSLDKLRQRFPNRLVSVYHLATNDHTDTLEAFDGEIRYLPRSPSLSNVTSLPQVNILLRFAPAASGSGEPYSSGWRATRGTHLALRMEESFDGPFATRPTTKIKIDPREGNTVVRLTHQLYEASTGGRPLHATLRPLLETDDAPSLSRLASNTDWVVFAAPTPLGLVAPRTINNTLRYVGRANMGCYGLYVYVADDMFPVRRYFEDFFKQTPMAAISPARMVDLLVEKAQESSDAVLFASLSTVPAKIGSLVALHVAKEKLSSDDISFTLSLDEMGWTRVWLPQGGGPRADFLVVAIDRSGKVLFQVLESKSEESGNKIVCDPNVEPYGEAITQVNRTLKAIEEISTATAPTLDQDLRYTSLIEHLMAAAMSSYEDLNADQRAKAIDTINKLSRREAEVRFEGVVVLTQAGINSPREVRSVNKGLAIVWSGNPDVEKTFGLSKGFALTTHTNKKDEGVNQKSHAVTNQIGTQAKDDQDDENTSMVKPLSSKKVETVISESDVGDMSKAFIAASKMHGIPVAESEPVYLQAGPSVVVFGMRLREGAKVKDLQTRIQDIARDAGFGDSAGAISVENDNEPRTVRVEMPRPDREFPSLPDHSMPAIGGGGNYLPILIGQEIDGRDHESSVEEWPHMLVAGTTNSGKTTFLKSLLRQAARHGAGRLRTLIVDGKGDTDYFGIVPQDMFPEPFTDIQLGSQAAIDALRWAVAEMDNRKKSIVELARKTPHKPTKAADLFKSAVREKRIPEVVPLLVVIDEFADIMLGNKKDADEFEALVQRIAQVGRASLVHVLLATQRPDRETVRGAIKANLNCRAVFRLPTQADSVTVLGNAGAEKLLFHGDMLFKSGPDAGVRLQGYSV
jgi:hypothetical protein